MKINMSFLKKWELEKKTKALKDEYQRKINELRDDLQNKLDMKEDVISNIKDKYREEISTLKEEYSANLSRVHHKNNNEITKLKEELFEAKRLSDDAINKAKSDVKTRLEELEMEKKSFQFYMEQEENKLELRQTNMDFMEENLKTRVKDMAEVQYAGLVKNNFNKLLDNQILSIEDRTTDKAEAKHGKMMEKNFDKMVESVVKTKKSDVVLVNPNETKRYN